jgi:tetratricopeptide (TPR) repeat protein
MNIHLTPSDLNNPAAVLKYKDAVAEALIDTPENPNVYILQAVVLMHEEKFEEALAYAKQGVGFDPTNAGHHVTLAAIHDKMGDREKSFNTLAHAYQMNKSCPALNWNFSLALLAEGMFQKGFDLYRWRRVHQPGHLRSIQPDFDHYKCNQKNLKDSTLLIWCEQGLGDIVMMFRFVKHMKKQWGFKNVIFEVPDELYTLFSRLDTGVDQLYVRRSDMHCPFPFHYHCSVMDLAYNLNIGREEDWEGSTPYITPNLTVAAQWEKAFAEDPTVQKTKIGICWSGTNKHPNDKNRSAQLKDFHPLNELGSVVGLQRDCVGDGRDDKPKDMSVLNCTPGMVNADFTTGLIHCLDYVVTVDTFIAHLAGAMGKKVYLLLPFVHEWRWGTGENECYLYKNTEFIKQTTPGDWSEPIAEVVKRIKCHTQLGLS